MPQANGTADPKRGRVTPRRGFSYAYGSEAPPKQPGALGERSVAVNAVGRRGHRCARHERTWGLLAEVEFLLAARSRAELRYAKKLYLIGFLW